MIKEGKIFNFIKNYLIDKVWTDKKFLERMGEDWINKLPFFIREIEFRTNNPDQNKADKVWVFIPLPACNDEWTDDSLKLSNVLIKEFDGYYDWKTQFLFNKEFYDKADDKNHHDLYLCVALKRDIKNPLIDGVKE